MRREPDTRAPGIENHKLALEEDIAQNLNRLPLATLQAAITHPAAQALVIEQLARDGRHVAFGPELHFQVRQGGAAGEDVAGVVLFGAGDFGVVGFEEDVVDEKERGAGVGDGGIGLGVGDGGVGADGEGFGGELPVALGRVDAGHFHFADELGGVDGAELVGAYGLVSEVGGEEGGFQGGGDVAEEGVLLCGRDGVALHEAEAHQAVRVGVLHERLGDLIRELDGLLGNGGAADE